MFHRDIQELLGYEKFKVNFRYKNWFKLLNSRNMVYGPPHLTAPSFFIGKLPPKKREMSWKGQAIDHFPWIHSKFSLQKLIQTPKLCNYWFCIWYILTYQILLFFKILFIHFKSRTSIVMIFFYRRNVHGRRGSEALIYVSHKTVFLQKNGKTPK